jgi:uncharacterized HAD superfamily protein
MNVIIMVDCDGTLYHNNGFNWVAEIRFPWQVIWFGLLMLNLKPNKVFIQHLNDLHSDNLVQVVSARNKELEEHTKNSLKEDGALFYNNVKCLGPGPDIRKRKVEVAKFIKADFVIDDDINVIMECYKENIPAYLPECFTSFF